jgi:hypothetical protein
MGRVGILISSRLAEMKRTLISRCSLSIHHLIQPGTHIQKWIQNLRSGSRARCRPIEKVVVLSIHIGYVSIYRRPVMHHSVIGMARIPLRGATQPLGLRWGFETTSSYHS